MSVDKYPCIFLHQMEDIDFDFVDFDFVDFDFVDFDFVLTR